MRARTWVTALSATTLVLTTAMVGAGSLTTANASGPTAQPAGSLVLTTYAGTTTGDGWSWTNPASSTTIDQPITTAASSCLVASPSGALVAVSSTNGSPGFAAHSLGVTQSATISSSCRQVGLTKTYSNGTYVTTAETLTVALANGEGGALLDPLFGAAKATSATLDLELKDESRVQVDLYDGATKVGTTKLITDENTGYPVPAGYLFCKNGLSSSSSSDPSGRKDNCTLAVSPTSGSYFDRLVITPLSGWVSLEGGGDWGVDAATHRTSFELVNFFDGSLNCTDQRLATVTGDGALTGVALTRLDNGVETPEGCVAVPYTLDASGDSATFHKPVVPGQGTAQYAIELTSVTTDGVLPGPKVYVDWEDGLGEHELGLCPVGLITGVDSGTHLPTGTDYSVAVPLDQSPTDDVQYACVYEPNSTYDNATGVLTTSNWVYVTGDILLTTKR